MKRFVALARAVATTLGVERRRLAEVVRDGGTCRPVTQPLEARVMLAGQQELAVLGVTAFRVDPRFVGINGTGQDIVVIDDSFDVAHKQFSTTGTSRVAYSHDFADNDADTLSIFATHGTHVSSIAAGTNLGIAPGARLILLKVFDDASLKTGNGHFTDEAVRQALQWVEDNNSSYHVAAVNMSFGDKFYNTTSAAIDSSTTYGANLTRLGSDNSMLLLAASGNSYVMGPNPLGYATPGIRYPAAHQSVVAVGASFEQNYPALGPQTRTFDLGGTPKVIRTTTAAIGLVDQFAFFSNRDPVMTDLVTPGYRVFGAASRSASYVVNGVDVLAGVPGLFDTFNGTSQATPEVAGAAALLQQVALEKYGGRIPAMRVGTNDRNMLDLMKDTARKFLDTGSGETYLDSNSAPGTAATAMPTTGAQYSRLDVYRAAERILEWQYGSGFYSNASTAIEFNQSGHFKGDYNPTAKDQHFNFVFGSPAANSRYEIKVFKPGNNKNNLPPAVIVRDTTPLPANALVRAPHGAEAIPATVGAGVQRLTLLQQVAPVGAYNSTFEVRGPKPDANHTHNARELGRATAASPYAASIGATDRSAHYFTFTPTAASGSLRVTIPGGSSLVPVLSVYDGKGNLLPNRTVGTTAGGATLNFSGLKVGGRYSVRVGSLDYATSGAFRIYADYPAAARLPRGGPGTVGGEAFTLASGTLTGAALEALRAGVGAFGRLADRYGGTAEMLKKLPVVGKSQSELSSLGAAVASAFTTPVLSGLSAATTVSEVEALLSSLSTTIGDFSLSAVPNSVAAIQRDDSTVFTVALQGVAKALARLNLDGIGASAGLALSDGTTGTVETTYHFDLEFGIKSDTSLAPADRATLKVNDFGIDTRLLDQALNAIVNQGLATGLIVDGSLDLHAILSALIHRAGGAEPAELTAAELDGAQIGDVVTNQATGTLAGSLPLDVSVGDYEKSDAVMELADPNIFDATEPTATKQNWGDLDLFAGVKPAELLSAIRGLQANVKSIAGLPVINTPIPFTDGQTLGQLLGIDELLVKVNQALSTAGGAVNFLTGDDLVTRVMQMLDMPFVTQNYDPATQELSFDIDYAKAISLHPNFRADVQTSILKLAAQADVEIAASLGFHLKFGIDLTPPQAGDSIASRFFLDDGQVNAGVHLTVANVNGSAKLFDFLGVALVGGSGDAQASIKFDLFGGQRVSLLDIGRSVANGGAAITGANPIPAAIGNLDYTGSGWLDLGTPMITGFSGFVPGAASKIKLNLPDFKNPTGVTVDTAQLGELLDFQNLSFDDLIGAIRTFVSGLKDKLAGSILSHKIPGTGKSIRDLVAFVDKLADAVQTLQNGQGTTLDAAKDLLQQKIRAALGLTTTGPIVSLDLTRVGLKKVISMRLTSTGSVSSTIPFNLDVDELLGGGSVGGLPALASGFIDASAAGSFTFDGSYNFALGFGVDLSSPAEPEPFVTNDTGFTLTAKVVADQTLQATLGVGPLAIYVKNGTIKLTDVLNGTAPARYAFSFPPTPPGQNGRIPLADALGQISHLDDRLTLDAAVDVRLPMFGPTSTQPLTATNGDPRGNVFTAQIPSVSSFFRGGASPTIYSPDIASLVGNINFSGGLGSLINGLDLLLANLSKVFKGQMFGIDLPLIGDKLKDTAPVAFLDDMRAKFAELLGTPDAVASQIRDRLQLALQQLGLTSIVVGYTAYKMVGGTLTSQGTTVDADTVQILFNLSGNGSKVAAIPLAFKKTPFPGLALEVKSSTGGDPTVNVDVAYALNLKFGINKDDGFFVDTSAANELSANAFVNFNGSPVLGGSLGFLKLTATNDTTQSTSFPAAGGLPARNFTGTIVGGTFSANLKPLVPSTNHLTFDELTRPNIFDQDILDYALNAKAKMALKMTLGTEGSALGFDLASLPKLTSDFLMNWSFSASDTAPGPSGSPDTIRFNNVKMDVGDFLSRQIRPVLASMEKAMAPIRPAIDLFQIALPVINDISSLRSAVDFNHDGRATLRDLVQVWAGSSSPALQFLDLFTSLDNLYNSIESLAVTPNLLITLGNFDVNVGAGGAASLVPFGAAPATIDAQLNTLGGSATVNAAKQFRGVQTAYAGMSGGKFTVPLFGDPMSALGLLIGKDVALVQIDFPKLEFGAEFSQSFPIFPAISVEVGAYLKGFADMGIGYDTRGFRQFYESGYSTPSLLANGFYLRDMKDVGGTLVDVPEFGFSGGINLYAGLDVFVFSLKVGGGIDAELFADFRDPNNDGRINLDEFLGNFGPGLFDMYGQITASLKAKAKIGVWPFSKTYTKNLATVTLVDFNAGGSGNVGTLSSGTLMLTGTGEDDYFSIRHISGDANTTAGEKIQVTGSGGTKVFDGVRRISFNGGAGDDRVNFVLEEIDANNDGVFESRTAVNAPATLIGGDGEDVLSGGDGNDSIDGGAGEDDLSGNYGNDTILGGDGDDAILGGAGNDSLAGGLGNDDIDAGLGNDTATGVAGNDTIVGGGGADSIDGGDGNDDLSGDDPADAVDPGPVGIDTILGGLGNDSIAGGGGNDSIVAGGGADTVQGDDGNDNIDGGTEDDSLAGNAGTDTILGGAGNDTILGHSGQAADAGADDDRLFGNDGNDSIDAGLGADRAEGGLGADTILGGAGNDTLVGGTGAAGTADGSADSIVGGTGFDWIFGDDGTVSTTNVVSLFNVTLGGADRLEGGDDGDSIYAQAGADYVSAGTGADSVLGGDGDDSLVGQDGNDTLLGEAGNDQVQGSAGSDSLVGGDGNDQILGGTGNDSIQGGLGSDELFGNEDVDFIYGNSGNDTVQGGGGADTLVGGGGADLIFGHSLSGIGDDGAIDLIYGGRAVGQAFVDPDALADAGDTAAGQGGSDVVFGEDGDDWLAGGDGNDSIDGGVGNDLLRGDAGNDTLLGQANDDVVQGGAGDDSIAGSSGNDRLLGEAGQDTLQGDLGNDRLDGGAGDDSLLGGDGNDTLGGDAGVDTLRGELGNDSLEAGAGGGELLDGGAGDDVIRGSTSDLPADTISGGDGGDTIFGLGGPDTIDAGTGDDWVDAGSGDDRVTLGDGNDTLYAGTGADSADGGLGSDTVYGEAGDDTLIGGTGNDLLDGGAGIDSLSGNAGDDDLRAGGGSGDQLFGEAGHDVLTGSDDGADLLEGGDGDDQLNGLGGADTVRGGIGGDVIDGGAGDDFVEGGSGADVLMGGRDHDVLYGFTQNGTGDDNAVDTIFGDLGTGGDDPGAGRDRLFGGGGFDVLYGEGNDDFISDYGSGDTVYFGAGDGATPNNFAPPGTTPGPTPQIVTPLPLRGVALPASGGLPRGRWSEFAGFSAGGSPGTTSGATSIAVDSADRRYVAWSDPRNGNPEIYVARFDGAAGWVQLAGSASLGGVSNTAGASTQPSIATDAAGNPIVVWLEEIGTGLTDVYAARFDGTAWVSLGASLIGTGISGTGSAKSPTIANTAAGPVVAWMDASSGTPQVYAKRFDGTSWVAAAPGSASDGGVSGGAAGVSGLAMATDGTRVAFAWAQAIGPITQVMLRELAGGALLERSGSATGNGASDALYGATAPTFAYFGGSLHLAFVTPLQGGSPVTVVVARRHDGSTWADTNAIALPAAGASGGMTAPVLAVGGGQLRLAWVDHRATPVLRAYASFARFDGSSFVADIGAAGADGFDTTATAFALAVDSTGRPLVSLAETGDVRALAGTAGALGRVFVADATTPVASILAANDLGPGDAIVVKGSVAGFTVAADDAGVLIAGDRVTGATITSAVTINAADVQLANLTITAAVTATAGGVTITNSSLSGATSVGGADVTVAGNTFTGAVTVGVASSGTISGNTFGGAAVTGLTISAAFTGAIRGNTFSGMAVGILVSAANAPIGGNTFTGNTVGVRVSGAGVVLGGTGLAPNVFRGNVTGVNLVGGGAVVRQSFIGNTTAVAGTGTVGGNTLADANTFDANATGVNVGGGSVVRFNRFTRNGVAVVAGAATRVYQNQISDSTGDGVRATGARVIVMQNSITVDGRAVDVTSTATEVELRNNVLVSQAGHAVFVDTAGRGGFFSDYNLIHAADGAHLVRWMGVDFDDILDWQQDVARFDLHSQGRTLLDPSATRPRFASADSLAAAPLAGGRRASSPAVDLGDATADVGVTRVRTNLLANPSFEAGTAPTGWTTNATGTTLTTPLSAWDAARYFTTGGSANGFVEQTVNLLTNGFTAAQLDTADLAAIFGARVRIAGATKLTLTFLNGTGAAIGAPAEFTGSADGARWELVGGRLLLPIGTRSIKLRIDGVAASTAIDSAFLYVESGGLANNAGYGGGTPDDLATPQPRIVLRSGDLYTDLIVGKPFLVRWDTYGNVNKRAVRVDLMKDDAANGPQFLLTIAATAPDTGSFEFRPSDYGLAPGTGGYRFRVSLVNEDVASDRSTEASAIPETGEHYYVDDHSDAGDEFTPGAVGSNRNTGKTAAAPKPLLTTILRLFDLGADSVVRVDAGNYVHFHTAVVSGTLGVGDDEGVTITGPADVAKVATLGTGAPFVGFDLTDGDAVTLRNLRITGASRGVDVRNDSADFTAQGLTVVSPTLQGVHLDSTALRATLDHITVTGAGSHGIWTEVMIGSITNAAVTGAAGTGILLSAGVGTISGSLVQGNLEGIVLTQSTDTVGTITGNRVIGNRQDGIRVSGNGQVTGNFVSGHTNSNFHGINLSSNTLAVASGNFLQGNYTGIYSSAGTITNNRVEGGTFGIEGYDNSIVSNVVTGSVNGIHSRSVNANIPEFVRNNLVYGNTAVGILLEANSNVTVENNTIDGGDAVGIQTLGGSFITLRNNTVAVRNGRGVVIGSDAQNGFASNYNLFYVSGAGNVGTWQGANQATLAAWRAASPGDGSSQFGDPRFVNPAAGDYHEQSAFGSFKGGSLAPTLDVATGLPVAAVGNFSNDAATTPALDRGDPTTPFSNETPPNGGRVNVGAFGNTPQASRSAVAYVTVTVPNSGEQWPIGQTFGITWISQDNAGAVDVTLMRGGSPVLTIAAGTANDGSFDWTVPAGLPTASDYSIRVTRTDNAGATDDSDGTFTIQPAVHTFYVNDAAQTGDEFTTAVGTIGGNGLSAATPNLSIRYILANYDLGPGDVIKVDAGTYNETSDIVIDAQDSGVTIEGPSWASPAAPKATINRGNTLTNTTVFGAANADGVTIRNLGLTNARFGVRLTTTSDADDWVIDRVRFTNFITPGLSAGVDVDAGNDRLVVRNSQLIAPSTGALNGIRSFAANSLIEGNSVSGLTQNGIQVNGFATVVRNNNVSGATNANVRATYTTTDRSTPILVTGNTVAVTLSDATGIGATGQVTIEGNTVTAASNSIGITGNDRLTLVKGNTVTGGLFGINLGPNARAVGNTVQSAVNGIQVNLAWVIGNTLRSNTTGVLVSAPGVPLVANNLMTGNTTGISYSYGSNPNAQISRFVNNTIVQTSGRGFLNAGTSKSAWLRNNVFSVSGGTAIEVATGGNIGFSSDYNLFHLSGTGTVGIWQGTVMPTLSAWQLAVNMDADGVAADPLFANASAGDYALRPGSHAIDRGDPDTYFLGEQANSGGRVDLGAFGNTTTSPASAARLVQVMDPIGGERYEAGTPQTIKVRGFGLAQTDAIATIDVGSGASVGPWLWDSVYAAPNTPASTTAAVSVAGVANAAPAAVYQTWATSGAYSSLRYDLPVADGTYTLRLHFAELSFAQVGQRVMDISVNGTQVADDFDIRGGGDGPLRAKVLDFDVTVAGGAGLALELADVVGDAALNGLELLRSNAGGAASPVVDVAYSANAVTPSTGSYSTLATGVALDRYGRASLTWMTPAVGTTDARIKVSSGDYAGVDDVSDDVFVVQAPSNDYYINDAVVDANDVFTTAPGNDANGGTSPSSPMASLAVLLSRYTLRPGSVVHVDAGTYALSVTTVIDAGDAGVRIEGAGAARTIFTRNGGSSDVIQLVNADGVQFADLAVTGGRVGIVADDASDSDDLLFERVRVFANTSAGVSLGNSNDRAVIRNSEFYGVVAVSGQTQTQSIFLTGRDGLITGNDVHHSSVGIYASGFSINALISSNTVHDNTDTGLQVGGGSVARDNTVANNRIGGIALEPNGFARNNLVYGTLLAGDRWGITINAGEASGNTVRNNTNGIRITNGLATGNTVYANTSIGVSVDGNGTATDNVAYGNAVGLYQTSSAGSRTTSNFLHLAGNLSYGNSTAALEINGGGTGAGIVRVQGNTLVATAGDAVRVTGAANSQQIDLRNNLIAAASGYGVQVFPGAHYHIGGDFNFYQVTGTAKLGRFANVDSTTLLDWRSRTLMDRHSLQGDARFVDPTAANYNVGPDSTSIDAGDPDSPYGVEPGANGGRVNVGHTGNTAAATVRAAAVGGRTATVISPDGNERYEVGQTVTVRYRSNDIASPPNTATVGPFRSAALGLAPAGYWALDDATGATTAADLSGNGQVGTYPSGGVTPGAAGRWDDSTAVNFDGTGGGITVPNAPPINPTRVSVSTWLNPAAGTTGDAAALMRGLYNNGGNWINGYGLYYTADGRVNFFAGSTSAGRVSAPVARGQWTNVVGTYDGATVRLFVNGQLAASRTATGLNTTSNEDLRIGAAPGLNAWTGGIDEPAVWGSALSENDVAGLYANANGAAGRTVTLELVRDGSATPAALIGTNLPLNGQVDWTVPAGLVLDADYRVRATYSDGAGNTAADSSNSPFKIVSNGVNYYVNDGSSTGDVYTTAPGDDGNGGKSPDRPMRSLQALLDLYDLDAGDTVYVDAGYYALPINLLIEASDSGVSIVGAGRDLTTLDRANQNGGSYVFELGNGATNVRLAKMAMANADAAVISLAASNPNVTVEDNAIFGHQSWGIFFQQDDGAVIRRNKVYGIPGGSVLDNQRSGIQVTGNFAQITDNEVYDNADTGIGLTGGAGVVTGNKVYRNDHGITVHHALDGLATTRIAGNDVFNNTTRGIYGNLDVLVSGNRVYGQAAQGARGIVGATSGVTTVQDNEVFGNYDGIVSGQGGRVTDNRVYANARLGIDATGSFVDGNTAYSNQVGLIVRGASQVTNNLVYGNTNTGLQVTATGVGGSTRVAGNTIYQDVGDAVQIISGATNVGLYGNILWTNSGRDVFIDAASQTGFVSNNNLFQTGAAANAHAGSFGGADRHTLADWKDAAGQDADSSAGDPLFVDIDGADNLLGYVGGVDRGRDDNFHLRANSPAIDHGDDIHQPLLDNAGETRADDPILPNGAAGFADIGAFEFQGRSDDATRPVVVSTTPASVHTGGTVGGVVNAISVTFSEALDTLDARSPTVYELLGAGADGNFGTSDDVTYSLVPQYGSLATNVTLRVADGPLPGGTYRLTIRGTPAGNSGLHDLAGNVLDGGSGAGYQRVFSLVPDQTPPTVTASTLNLNAPGMRITTTFSEDIAALTPGNVVLRNTTNAAVGVIADGQLRVEYDATTRAATISYLGAPNGVLPDGNYTLTIRSAAISDAAGNELDGDGDGRSGGDHVFSFFQLIGDATRDRVVNFDDLLALAKNYNGTGKTLAQGDFNADGTVNFDDLLLLAKNYNKALPPPTPGAAAAPALVAVGSTVIPSLSEALAQASGTKPVTPASATVPRKPAATPKPVPQPKPAPKPVPTPPKLPPKPAPKPTLAAPKQAAKATTAATPPVFSAKKIAPAKKVSELLA